MNINKSGLIIESMELSELKKSGEPIGVKTKKHNGCTVTNVNVKTDEHAKTLGREIGEYITVEFEKAYKITDTDFESLVDVLANEISFFTNEHKGRRIFVAGIGNKNITADSIGPKSVERIIVTRGLEDTEFISTDCFGNVCAVATDVFGVTGIESAEIIEGIVHSLKPALLIVIDSLSTSSLDRLCKTVQISNTSLTPGGGVGNSRKTISSNTLGVPIISIGMPTVIDASVLSKNDFEDNLVAMPACIDDATDIGAKIIAFSLNKALHGGLTTDDILKFLY